MDKRFYYDEFLEEIYDSSIDDYPSNQTICGILNDQDQRIAELEEQLKNAIVLPQGLKVGDTVYFVDEDGVLKGKVVSVIKELDLRENCFVDWFYCVYEDGLRYHHLISDIGTKLFATKEEAQERLKNYEKL